MIGGTTRVGIPKGVMPRKIISHTQSSSQNYFMRGSARGSPGVPHDGRSMRIPMIETPWTP